jgi:prophage antirepressor-like protein
MTEITPFTFPTTGQSVRTLLVDGEPWFVAADVTDLLGYANGRDAVSRLPERMKSSVVLSDGTPGNPNRTILSEPGVYRLVMRSGLLAAEAFQDWLAEEVVPSIRKTGSYSVPRELSRLELIDLARDSELARIEAENRACVAEHQVLELTPAARMHDELMAASGDFSVREAAQILDRDPSLSTGQRRLFEYLRSIGWLDRHNQPYQRHIDIGRLTVRARSYEHPHRDELVATQQVRVTTKGLGELHRLLGGGAQFQALMSEEVSA